MSSLDGFGAYPIEPDPDSKPLPLALVLQKPCKAPAVELASDQSHLLKPEVVNSFGAGKRLRASCGCHFGTAVSMEARQFRIGLFWKRSVLPLFTIQLSPQVTLKVPDLTIFCIQFFV